MGDGTFDRCGEPLALLAVTAIYKSAGPLLLGQQVATLP